MKIKKIHLVITILTLLLNHIFLLADEPIQHFKLGNNYYDKGNYKKAINEYEEITKKNIKNSSVFYNLANAYYKSGKLGKAIVNYERTKLLSPRDHDLEFNLKFARMVTKDKIPEIGIVNFVSNFFDSFTINELTITCTIIYFILLIIIGASILLKKFRFRTFLLILSSSAFIIIGSALINKINLSNSIKGIIIDNEAEIRSGPGDDNTLIFTVHEGTKVELLKQEAEYYEVLLPNGEKGWVKSKKMEII